MRKHTARTDDKIILEILTRQLLQPFRHAPANASSPTVINTFQLEGYRFPGVAKNNLQLRIFVKNAAKIRRVACKPVSALNPQAALLNMG
jgi:hypothetical protein